MDTSSSHLILGLPLRIVLAYLSTILIQWIRHTFCSVQCVANLTLNVALQLQRVLNLILSMSFLFLLT